MSETTQMLLFVIVHQNLLVDRHSRRGKVSQPRRFVATNFDADRRTRERRVVRLLPRKLITHGNQRTSRLGAIGVWVHCNAHVRVYKLFRYIWRKSRMEQPYLADVKGVGGQWKSKCLLFRVQPRLERWHMFYETNLRKVCNINMSLSPFTKSRFTEAVGRQYREFAPDGDVCAFQRQEKGLFFLFRHACQSVNCC